MPANVLLLQLIANELGQKRSGQPTVNLALNLLLLPARFRFIQFHGQTAERLQHPAEAGSQTVQLFAGKGSRVFHHAQCSRPWTRVFSAVARTPGWALLQAGNS